MVRKLHFKTNVHIKNVLGQDLINDDFVAVQELVKNAFDAGSKKVDIVFKNIKSNSDLDICSENRDKLISLTSKIIIKDLGEGMSISDIEDKWLNIAYSSKRKEREKYNRVQAGAKGVGRFSCDRLGEYLDIYTKKKNDTSILHLKINWNDFENHNSVNDIIENVDIILEESLNNEQLYERIGYNIEKSGTILEISKLRRNWIPSNSQNFDFDSFIDLKKNLEKFINPNQKILKTSFKIYLKINDLDEKDYNLNEVSDKEEYNYLNNSLVENKIYDKLAFRVSEINCTISPDGESITTILKDRNRTIFTLKEKNRFKFLKDIKVNLTYLNQYAKAYFKRQMGYRSIEFGSVFLFINGFRVSPFGDYGNDWLGLDMRKTQGQMRYLGTRDCLGRIEINDINNEVFKIVSNREGLVRNSSYEQLAPIGKGKTSDYTKTFFYYVLRKLEIFVSEVIAWDKLDNKEDPYLKGIEVGIFDYNPLKESLGIDEEERESSILSKLSKVILITSNKEDIIKLDINMDILKKLSKEQSEKVESFISQIENEGIKFDVKTSKGISNIKKSIALLAKKAREEEKKRTTAENKAEKAEEDKKKAEEDKKEIEEDKKKVEEEKEELETQNLFLKSTKDQSKDQLIKYHHYIKTKSQTIELLTKKILNISKNIDVNEKAKKLNFVNKQIYTISNIALHGGITNEMNSKKIDLVTFFKQYIENIHKNKLSTLKIHIIQKSNFVFNKSIRPFEIAYMIDCILDNSRKMHAKNIFFTFYYKNNSFFIEIKDDGNGLPVRFEKDPSVIFKEGITTTNGSGLGLYDSKNIISNLKGKISVVNEEKGIKFLVEIKE